MIDNKDKPNFLINRQDFAEVIDEISDDIGDEIGEIPCENCAGRHFQENARLKVFSTQVGGSHYKTEGIPPGFPDPAEFCIQHNLGGAETNVVKYVFRHNRKNKLEDLRKAKQWLEFLAAVRYNATL